MGRTALFSFLLNHLLDQAAFGRVHDQRSGRTVEAPDNTPGRSTTAAPTALRLSTSVSPELSSSAGRLR